MEMGRKSKFFSKQFIMQVMGDLESGMSRTEVCDKYSISYSTVGEWIPRYASPEFLKKRKPNFTQQRRKFIIRSVLEGKMTRQEASLAHGIAAGTLRIWLREYKVDNPDIEVNQSPMSTSREQDLQRALQASQLKVLALETLIEVAEQELNIKIVKKPGTKQ